MNKLIIADIKKLGRVLGLGIVLTTTSLDSCNSAVSYIEDQTEIYDYIDSNDGDVRIKPQELEVLGEDFKLVVEYSLDENTEKKWRVTANKEINTKVYTKGLPKDTKVWIDNVHTDISIVASKERMNGIKQDSIDDRIHNSLMYGFPVSDDRFYYANMKVEGQNDDFITGSFYGFKDSSVGITEEKRYEEYDYLRAGVYANMISSSYGLLIQKGDDEPYGVDVSSNILVLVNNEIKTVDEDGKTEVHIFDQYGNHEVKKVEEKEKVKK